MIRSVVLAPVATTDITFGSTGQRKQLKAVRDDAVKFLADGQMTPLLKDKIMGVQELEEYRNLSDEQAASYIILAAELD